MSEKSERTRLSFASGSVELVGYFYRPAHATGKVPCVVMGHGFGGTQDRLVASAERFAGAGFAVLTFDYRNFVSESLRPFFTRTQLRRLARENGLSLHRPPCMFTVHQWAMLFDAMRLLVPRNRWPSSRRHAKRENWHCR